MKLYNHIDTNQLKEKFSLNKTYPAQYEKAILIALSRYPELTRTKINFQIKKTLGHFLLTETALWNIFRRKEQRTFNISIQEDVSSRFTLKELSYEAQIGAISRELSLISLFCGSNYEIIANLFTILHTKRNKSLEVKIDRSVIEHGLATQLFEYAKQTKQLCKKGSTILHVPHLEPDKIVSLQNQQLGL
ncbi:MAG: hypothetical protein ACJ77K_06270 [Bacteroidia bacterium]